MAVSPNTILGKYRIIREIARSNDIVYEAIDPKMNRRVAIKELQLPLHLAGTQKRERVERFYREAKAAGTLTHPNIVTIHEVGQENERHFLVMEYLDGQSLRDILQLQGALPLKETVEIALQLCDALGYAHSHGVVHRDVKPDNVHILPGGIIKLTDFGIARITAEPSITSQGQVFGTPSYMSPEQVASQTVDHRTDLFSLGITLYEMLTGRKPFVGDSVITITYNIMNSQPPMPVGIPAPLQAILQKGMAKDANLRYQSAAAMAADLRAEKFALSSPQADSGRSKLGGLGASDAGDAGRIPPPLGVSVAGVGGPQPSLPVTPPPTSLDTGIPPPPESVNGSGPPSSAGRYSQAHISPSVGGLPASDARPRPVKRRSGSSQTRNILSLALMIFGLLCLIGLIVWGAVTAFHAVQGRGHAEIQPYVQPYAPASAQVANTSPTPPQQAAPPAAVATMNAAFPSAAPPPPAAVAVPAAALQPPSAAAPLPAPSPDVSPEARHQAALAGLQQAGEMVKSGNTAGAISAWQGVIAADPGSPEAQQAQRGINSVPLNQTEIGRKFSQD